MYSSMKLFLLLTFLFAFSFYELKAQKTFKSIRSKIQSADSVWIISHEVTGVFIKNENGKSSEVMLVENGKLHRELISKSILLDADGKSQLVKMLARSSTSSKVEMAKCFFGEHAIVWKKDKKFSCIDIAFSCHRLRETPGVENSFPEFDNNKWRELEAFFKEKGIIL